MFHSFQAANRGEEEEEEESEEEVDDGAESLAVASGVGVGASSGSGVKRKLEEEPTHLSESSAIRQRSLRGKVESHERLLLVGVACVDVIDRLETFPQEDGEYRSLERRRCLGGNSANTVRVASQFDGVKCSLVYATASEDVDPTATYVRNELEKSHVLDMGVLTGGIHGLVPSSYVIQCNSTRTIIHNRGLPELTLADFTSVYIPFGFSWVHFEARVVEETRSMLEHVSGSCTISLEIEKERKPGDVLSLTALADVVIFSRAFAKGRGFNSPHAFLDHVVKACQWKANAKAVVAWGEEGAFGVCISSEDCDTNAEDLHVLHAEARPVKRIVDTIGAGDTFNAGLLVGLLRGYTLLEAMRFGCNIAGLKCEQQGFDGLAVRIAAESAKDGL